MLVGQSVWGCKGMHPFFHCSCAICGFIYISTFFAWKLLHTCLCTSAFMKKKEKKQACLCACTCLFTGCSSMQEEWAWITCCRRLCCVHVRIRLDGKAERYGRVLLFLFHGLIKAWGLPYFSHRLLIQHSQMSVCPEYDCKNIPVTVALIPMTCYVMMEAAAARQF